MDNLKGLPEQVGNDLGIALELVRIITPYTDKMKTVEGFASFIGALADDWCDTHNVDAERFRKELNNLMYQAHEVMGQFED